MLRGIVLGFLSYAVFSWGDAAVKALGGRLPVFEISFFVTLFALIALPAVRPRHENWRDMFRMHRPGLVLLRSVSGMTAGILGVLAFTTLPFAEAYALIFLSPIFATLLSVIFLGERIGWRRSLAIVVGFAGVLIVVRPGFRELQVGHFAAIAVALCAAITVIVLRTLGPTEKRITLMGVPLVLSLMVTAAAHDHRVPPAERRRLRPAAARRHICRHRPHPHPGGDARRPRQPHRARPIQPDRLGGPARRALLRRIPRRACADGNGAGRRRRAGDVHPRGEGRQGSRAGAVAHHGRGRAGRGLTWRRIGEPSFWEGGVRIWSPQTPSS